MKNHLPRILAPALLASLIATQAHAADYHVATAQALQNALTLAANNGANNNIYVTNGYYTGNFNYNSSGGYSLVVSNEPNITNNTQITLDGAGGGRALSITSSGTSAITIAGLTFSRNCGSATIGALRIAGGTGSVILVNGCQFLSPTNTSGMGLELASGLNATVTNCTASGANSGGGGAGISISGITGTANVQSCNMTTNYSTSSGGGLSVSGAGVVLVTASLFIANSGGSGYAGSGNGGGAYLSAGTITLSGNMFATNSAADYEGEGGAGGGVYCAGSATLINNTFTANSCDLLSGGGVYCAGNATLINNTFTANSGSYSGGGAYFNGAATLSGNTFNGNSIARNGGGAFFNGAATLNANIFNGNSAPSGGGGVNCTYITTLTNNTFIGNSASAGSGGGAYANCNSSITNAIIIYGNTFQQNSAVSGGGLYASGPTVNLLDNLVVKNSQTSSGSQGGGIWVDATSNLFMINNTVTGNTSAGSGGGVAFVVTGTVELLNVYNNIIWGNLATVNGGDVHLSGTGQRKVFDYNDVDSMYGVWDIAQNNIDLSPQFFNPISGDYHLQSTSPCLNAGTNGAPSLPLTDLDGNSRTNSAGLVDMGCYEFNTTATHPADTDTNFIITAAEFNAYAAAWKSGQTWTNAPNPIPANYVTRAGYLMTNGGAYTNDGSARPVNWKIGH